jgi:hypothetical protein
MLHTWLDFVRMAFAWLTALLIFHWIEKRFLIASTIKRYMLCTDREHPEASNVYARVFAKRVTDGGFSGDYDSAHAEAVDAAAFVERKLEGGPERGYGDAELRDFSRK